MNDYLNGRVCILCTPRSGSQLCAKIISELNSATDLGEYFENWNRSEYQCDDKNYIVLSHTKSQDSLFEIDSDYQNKIKFLSAADQTQPMTIRLFVMNHYSQQTLLSICSSLNKIGFKFVKLSRANINEQLLSYAIALSSKKIYKRNIFGIGSSLTDKIYISPEIIDYTLKILKPSIENFHHNVDKCLSGITFDSVTYENIYQDLEKIYHHPFGVLDGKTIKGNPWDNILNAAQISAVLNS
jgi:LPS sulfotransferase NodH